MKRLFDEMPFIESEDLILRPMTREDIPEIEELTGDSEVYRYLPSFLYEQKYVDKGMMLDRMEEECFRSRESILLAVCPKESGRMAGIAEIYNYEPEKEKASIGCRLLRRCWHLGIAPKVAVALTKYLFAETDVRKITAHVIAGNKNSGRVLEKIGYERKWPGLTEDWGLDEPVTVDKYIIRRDP